MYFAAKNKLQKFHWNVPLYSILYLYIDNYQKVKTSKIVRDIYSKNFTLIHTKVLYYYRRCIIQNVYMYQFVCSYVWKLDKYVGI